MFDHNRSSAVNHKTFMPLRYRLCYADRYWRDLPVVFNKAASVHWSKCLNDISTVWGRSASQQLFRIFWYFDKNMTILHLDSTLMNASMWCYHIWLCQCRLWEHGRWSKLYIRLSARNCLMWKTIVLHQLCTGRTYHEAESSCRKLWLGVTVYNLYTVTHCTPVIARKYTD